MIGQDLSIPIAYLAGIASFFSPCLIPLLPSYYTAITGFTFKELYGINFSGIRTRVFLSSVFFVLGFASVYSILGATGAVVGRFIQDNINILIRFSGIFIILLGLIQLGVIRFNSIEFDYAWNIQKKLARLGYLSAFITGLSCALIWMPCVGQILGAMLIIASKTETAFRGFTLLLVFSLGLGTPFLLLGLFFPYIFRLLQSKRELFHYLSQIAGVILILFGVVLLIDQYGFFLTVMSQSRALFELIINRPN
jgi:cytochrome c-type biogenesis protein